MSHIDYSSDDPTVHFSSRRLEKENIIRSHPNLILYIEKATQLQSSIKAGQGVNNAIRRKRFTTFFPKLFFAQIVTI